MKVHYRIDAASGLGADAPTVVLAGSLGSSLEMWDPQLPALTPFLRVVRFDIRGHGDSPVPDTSCRIDDLADDLVDLLDRLEIARPHLVGLSLGGMTAMRLAARDPARVNRLVVLCSSARLGPAQSWRDRAAVVRERGTAAVADGVAHRWFSEEFVLAHPDEILRYRKMIAGTSPGGYASCCDAIAEMDLRVDLPRIAAPTLAIGGLQDLATPPEHLQAIADGIPGARLEILDPGAHLVSAEQPERVNELLLQHLLG